MPWWIYYHVLSGYNGAYVSIFLYATVGLAALYAVFALCYAIWSSKTRRAAATRSLARPWRKLQALSNINRTNVATLTLLLGAGVVAYSLATRLQSGYVPFFLPLAPLVVYASAYAVIADGREAGQLDITYTRYLVLTLILLSVVTALGFVAQFGAATAGTLPIYLQSNEALSLDLGGRFANWVAFVYGIMATIGLILVSNGIHVTRRRLVPSLMATLLVLAAVNATVLAVNYDASFSVTAPPDSRVIATALWTAGKDPDNATMTDYRNEMIYWYYTGASVVHTPLTECATYTQLDYIYLGYFQRWNGPGDAGINYMLVTAMPAKYYSEHLHNGQYKLNNQNATQWQARIAAIDNGKQALVDKIYTNGYTYYYKVVGW